MVIIMKPGLLIIILAGIYSDAHTPLKSSFLRGSVRLPACQRAGFIVGYYPVKLKFRLRLKKKGLCPEAEPVFFFLTAIFK
jgi:hypothetical protein